MHAQRQNTAETVSDDVGRCAFLLFDERRQFSGVVIQRAANRRVAKQRNAHVVLAFEPTLDEIHARAMGQIPMHADDVFVAVTQCAVLAVECRFP